MNLTRYNGPMEKTPALREKRRLDNLEQMIPYLFALGCARTWMTLTFAAPGAGLAVPFDPHVLFDYLYAGFGIAATLLARSLAPLHRHPWAKPGAAGAMLAASLCIIAVPAAPEAAGALAVGAAVFGSFGFCTVLLMYNEAMVPLSLIRIALYSATSRFIAVPLAYLCQGLSGDRFAVVLVLLPLVAVGSLALAFRALPERETTPRAYPKFSFPVKPLAVLCIYAFAYGCAQPSCPPAPGCTRRCRPPLSWAGSSLSCTSSRTASR